MRRFCVFLVVLVAIMSCCAYAHPGRTDSQGGHTNHETGEYHFHHGYPAHQHPNGECPYETPTPKPKPTPTRKPTSTPRPKPTIEPTAKPTPYKYDPSPRNYPTNTPLPTATIQPAMSEGENTLIVFFFIAAVIVLLIACIVLRVM
jgi:hypothetical protein